MDFPHLDQTKYGRSFVLISEEVMLRKKEEIGQNLGIISFRHDVSGLPSTISSHIEWHIYFFNVFLDTSVEIFLNSHKYSLD